jgi:hypothetical protein
MLGGSVPDDSGMTNRACAVGSRCSKSPEASAFGSEDAGGWKPPVREDPPTTDVVGSLKNPTP